LLVAGRWTLAAADAGPGHSHGDTDQILNLDAIAGFEVGGHHRLRPDAGDVRLAFGILDLLLFNYPLVLSGIALGLVLIVLVGIPSVAASSGGQTLIQRDVPDRYRGRVFAALGTTSAALMLVATLIAGVVGETVGPIAMLNVQGAAYVVSGVVVLVLLAPARLARAARGRDPLQPPPVSAASSASASSGEKPHGPGLPG